MTTNMQPFFQRSAIEVAPELIGCFLFYHGAGGAIVETEAYELDDPASHSVRGLTERNSAMFGQPGTAYVYRSYGLHFCLNIVCRRGSAVLIRALEPTAGLALMQKRRKTDDVTRLCSGPGRLCQALGVTLQDNQRLIGERPFSFSPPQSRAAVISGRRIGISKAVDLPWRFGAAGSRYLSKKFATHETATPPQGDLGETKGAQYQPFPSGSFSLQVSHLARKLQLRRVR